MVNNIPVNGWPQLKDLEAVQPILNRLDKIEAWKRTVKEETFTGDDITIENALALPARSLITEINAIQPLHGYDHPWAGGAYKNKYKMRTTSATVNGITVTSNSDQTVQLSGTATDGSASIPLCDNLSEISTLFGNGGTFTMSLKEGTYGGTLNVSIAYAETQGGTTKYLLPNTPTEIPAGSIAMSSNLYVAEGTAVQSLSHFAIQLEVGNTATTFAPYSNICPISGRTEARVVDDGANLANKSAVSTNASGAIATSAGTIFTAVEANKSYVLSFNLKEKMSASSLQNRRLSLYLNDSVSLYQWTDADTSGRQRITITPTASGYLNFWAGADVFSANTEIIDDIYLTDITTTATIQLGTTVYGAEVDFNEGTAEVTDGYIASYDGETLPSTWISDRDVYAEGTTPTTGAEVVYKLATPTTIQLTPTQLQMLKGYNRITLTDGYGTIELKALTGANWS